jgi:hypothetical protein
VDFLLMRGRGKMPLHIEKMPHHIEKDKQFEDKKRFHLEAYNELVARFNNTRDIIER